MVVSSINPRFDFISVSKQTNSAVLGLCDDTGGVIHCRFANATAAAKFVLGLIDGVEAHVQALKQEEAPAPRVYAVEA